MGGKKEPSYVFNIHKLGTLIIIHFNFNVLDILVKIGYMKRSEEIV